MRAQVARAELAHGSQRAKLLRGAELRYLLQGLQQIRSIVALERARIAYEHAHPGLLPAM